jgi:hypothetical protein
MRLVFSFIFMVFINALTAQISLFPITDNNKQGFIDSTGKVIIKPEFNTILPFAEGLAPARKGGYYGYIDSTGNWQIPPQYDYATLFSEGLAIVFKQGKPCYIDHNGQIPFVINNATKLGYFKNGLASIIVRKKTGLINRKGQWFLKPIYESIYGYDKGLFKTIIYGKNKSTHTEGVINTLSHWLVPMNIYSNIEPFKNDYAQVTFMNTENKDWSKEGFINRKGELVFSLTRSHILSIGYEAFVRDSTFVVTLGRKPKASEIEKGVSWSSEWDYEGLMNLKGEIIFDSFPIKSLKPVSYGGKGIYEASDKDKSVFYIDRYGKHTELPTNQSDKTSNKNTEITDSAAIELALKALDSATKDEENQDIPNKNAYFRIKDKTERMTYVDSTNKVIWQAASVYNQLDTLDIDFMERGGFYAHSESKESSRENGWGGSHNGTNAITDTMNFPKNQLTLAIRTSDTVHIGYKWLGYKVFIANNTKDTFRFEAQDSRLYMNMQALDEKNNWRDIEYLPSSWCGNSYHVLALDPHLYWTFQTALYKGTLPTRLRLKLGIKNGKKKVEIYSNEIEASINYSQFWRKQSYSPNGLMDPYND